MNKTFINFLQKVNFKNEKAQAAIEQAVKYWKNKDYSNAYDKAIEGFSIAIRLNPNDARGYFIRGATYREKDQYDQAIKDFEKALSLDPNFELAKQKLEKAKQMLQKTRAISDLTKAIKLNPNDAAAYRNRGYAYDNLYQYDKAISDFSEAIRLDPNNAEAYKSRGEVYSWIDQYDQAIGDYNEAIRLDPNDSYAYECRGEAYKHLGQTDQTNQAIQPSKKSLKLTPDEVKELLRKIELDDIGLVR